jgi:hypothetical protein
LGDDEMSFETYIHMEGEENTELDLSINTILNISGLLSVPKVKNMCNVDHWEHRNVNGNLIGNTYMNTCGNMGTRQGTPMGTRERVRELSWGLVDALCVTCALLSHGYARGVHCILCLKTTCVHDPL